MKHYKHNLSYYNLTTLDMGKLVPVGLTEVLPGDVVQHHANALIRVSPLASPIMHNITARIHHFFVPHRLVWDGWEDFITGGPDGNNADTIPTTNVASGIWAANNLYDYFGVPQPSNPTLISALPFRAYAKIYNEYYRDQDLVPEFDPEASTDFNAQQIAWEKDYFTTCRPFSQKGPQVTLPVADKIPIVSTGETINGGYAAPALLSGSAPPSFPASWPTDGSQYVYADGSQAEAIDVNDFRKAFALQRYQEARARFGSRYVEYLKYLGVRNPLDARLQRPEFLGGGTAQLQISEILQTAPETGQQPTTEFGVGDMYGHGIGAMRGNKYRRYMEEHGYVISLLSVRPKAIYANGVDRTWLRQHKEDFFQKELQHIGQQEVFNNEVYFGGADGDATFGYQDRYAEYRQNFSRVTGEYRSLLNYWHMAREFASQPVLNQSFTDCVPTKRIHNEQTQHALWCAIQHKMVARRIVDRSAMPRIY